MSISLTQQKECIERELKLRKRTYGRWVERGKMTKKFADWEITKMEAVLETLTKLAKGESLF